MTRVAAVDCGTNTIKLLVADLDPVSGEARELVRESRMVRLGQGVDRSGRLAEEALGRVFAAVEEFASLVEPHDVQTVRFCATSAARDAENAAEFVSGIKDRTGVDPEVIDGDEEAGRTEKRVTRARRAVEKAAGLLVAVHRLPQQFERGVRQLLGQHVALLRQPVEIGHRRRVRPVGCGHGPEARDLNP